MTGDVVTWLRGVHERAEQLARDSSPGDEPDVWSVVWDCRIEGDGITIYDEGGHSTVQAELICMNDPAATLARVEAERAVLNAADYELAAVGFVHETDMVAAKRAWARTVLACLALGWRHMPGYDPAWR